MKSNNIWTVSVFMNLLWILSPLSGILNINSRLSSVSFVGSSGRFISLLTGATILGWITSAKEDPVIGYYSGSTRVFSLYCFKKVASDSA
jgi:hypothetical protein